MPTEQPLYQQVMALIRLTQSGDHEAMDMFLADLDSEERGELSKALAIAYTTSITKLVGEHAEVFINQMWATMFIDEGV